MSCGGSPRRVAGSDPGRAPTPLHFDRLGLAGSSLSSRVPGLKVGSAAHYVESVIELGSKSISKRQ